MKRLVLFVAVTALVVFTWAGARAEPALGAARLHQVDQSGVKARILFLDSGSPDTGLVVAGTATGLDPTQAFFTLVYDAGALPAGPRACEPSPANNLTVDQMGVDFWTVNPDGTGNLFRIKTDSAYAPLSDIGAVSIRHVVGPPPEGFILQACGRVHRTR
jgi:hypothetical protein